MNDPTASISNAADSSMSDSELRAWIAGLDNSTLLAQELTQKGAMHAVRFLLESSGDIRALAEQMRNDMRWQGMIISEECARRGLPVVAENG